MIDVGRLLKGWPWTEVDEEGWRGSGKRMGDMGKHMEEGGDGSQVAW